MSWRSLHLLLGLLVLRLSCCKDDLVSLIIGIDPSSKSIAAAVYEMKGRRTRPHLVVKYTAESKKYEPWVAGWASNTVTSLMINYINETEQDITVFLESPIVGRGGVHPTIVQSYVSGAIQSAFAHRNIPLYLVNVGEWKKATVGKGNADKEAVRNWVESASPKLFKMARQDQDMIDAIAIARYGVQITRTSRKL